MGNTLMEISVPLDKENFIELECDFCKNRFMLHQDVYESDDNINFFCPICGLPNKINTFFVPEVLEKAQNGEDFDTLISENGQWVSVLKRSIKVDLLKCL